MRANGPKACERAQRPDARTHAACARSGAARRWALLRNMVTDLIKHERIQTTVAKAKEVSANVRGFPALRAARWAGGPAAADSPHARAPSGARLAIPTRVLARCAASRLTARVPLDSSSAWRTR